MLKQHRRRRTVPAARSAARASPSIRQRRQTRTQVVYLAMHLARTAPGEFNLAIDSMTHITEVGAKLRDHGRYLAHGVHAVPVRDQIAQRFDADRLLLHA